MTFNSKLDTLTKLLEKGDNKQALKLFRSIVKLASSDSTLMKDLSKDLAKIGR